MKVRFVAVPLVLIIHILSACATPAPVQEQQPTTPAVVQPPATPLPDPQAAPQTFTATKEQYDRTFDEVEKLIAELNAIIRAGDFQRWKDYLMADYLEMISAPDHLRRANDQPIIRRQNLTIKTVADYFTHVVVPSRMNARLQDLEFSDSTRVQAFTVIGGTRVLLYQLEKEAGSWKISSW